MTAGTLTYVVTTTVMMGVIRTEKCPKLDLILWDYPSCPYPESEDWDNLKLKMNCDGDHVYHCASNSQGCDVLLCVKRVYCEAGHRPLLDPDKDTAICAPCPPDRYQTVGFWSNERSYCEHEKTQCDGYGQIECQPGSTTTDRSCRCDIHQNLALQSYALHTATCCTNNDPWCECVNFKSPCTNGTVRHDNYKCLEECPPNHFRHWDSETCYPNSTPVKVETITSTVKKTTEYDQMTTTSHQTSLSGSTGSPDTVNVGLLVGLIIVGILGLAGLMVGLVWVCHRMKKRKKGPPKDEEQTIPFHRQISGRGGPGERTANGHIDGSELVDMTNGNLAHVKVYSEVQDTSSVSEGEATENDQLLQSPSAEAGLSTKGTRQDLSGNEISKEAGQVIVYKNCKFVNNKTTKVRGGTGNTIILGEKNRTKTTINENRSTGNEDTYSSESMESSNGRNSRGGDNPENQSNPHRPDHNMPQQQTQGEGIESVMSTDTEPENRPVEHEERDEQYMAELKLHTGSDQSRMPEEISMIGSISEETDVKLIHESMEEVRPEEVTSKGT